MKRMLVVVDGSVQANLALDQALDIARAAPHSKIVLLNILPLPSPWQRHRPDDLPKRRISERVTALALARVSSAGIAVAARIEAGDVAEVAAKVAREEGCDHIFLPGLRPTPVVGALMSFAGLGTSTTANRISSLSRVPVTVVAHAH